MGAEFDTDIQNWAKIILGTYGVNGGRDTKNEIHDPGVSTHARFTRRLGLSFLWTRKPSRLPTMHKHTQLTSYCAGRKMIHFARFSAESDARVPFIELRESEFLA